MHLLHTKLRGVKLQRRVAVEVTSRGDDGLHVLLAEALAMGESEEDDV